MLEHIQSYLGKSPYINLVYLSIGLGLIYQFIKYFILKKIDSSEHSTDEEKIINKRRVREYGKFILLIAIFSLWFFLLQTVFVSLLAFSAAIVIAFKEVIMCIIGGVIVRLNKHFSTGDRIEVNNIRGFFIKKSESILLNISKAFLKKAGDSISKFCKKEGILIPTIEPRVKLLLSESNEAKLLLKMPVDKSEVQKI